MASTYTGNVGLELPAFGDPNWNVPVVANYEDLDSLAPIGGLATRPVEIPSASLNVRVAAGDYPNSDGSKGVFAGVASQTMPASATTSLWVDATGVLTLGASYPTTVAHVPLATVVASAATITSIQDDRVPGGLVLKTLVNAANDAAAAALGVSVGSEYRNGSVLMLRIA